MLQRRFELRLFIALRAKSLLILFLSARRQGGNRRYRICVRSSIPCKRQKKRRSVDRLFSGAPAEIRTPDTLLKRQVLCLLSYWGILNWLGWRDSNPLYQSQSLRCYHYTTSHHLSCFIVSKGRAFVRPSLYMGWVKGLEPSTPGTTIRCSNQLSYTHHIIHLARQEGFEPPTYCLEGSCSILLSYWRIFSTCSDMERAMGIEPTYPAWKAGVLPLNYARMAAPYIQP